MCRNIRQDPFVFSDQSRFCRRTDCHWVWKRPGDFQFANLAQTAKSPKFSVMVWGAISINCRSPLIVFETAVDSKAYIDSLTNQFFPHAMKHYRRCDWTLMQDGVTCHTSRPAICRTDEMVPSLSKNRINIHAGGPRRVPPALSDTPRARRGRNRT
jgi:hypothetical protein